jgi:hypothetical protein
MSTISPRSDGAGSPRVTNPGWASCCGAGLAQPSKESVRSPKQLVLRLWHRQTGAEKAGAVRPLVHAAGVSVVVPPQRLQDSRPPLELRRVDVFARVVPCCQGIEIQAAPLNSCHCRQPALRSPRQGPCSRAEASAAIPRSGRPWCRRRCRRPTRARRTQPPVRVKAPAPAIPWPAAARCRQGE